MVAIGWYRGCRYLSSTFRALRWRNVGADHPLDEDNYEQAVEFVPERWYSKPDMIKHKNAFAPFSLGSEGCIGKNRQYKSCIHSRCSFADVMAVAYIEMRTLATQLLLAYDVALAPGEDGHKLLYETRDHFTLGPADLNLVFTPASS